ncbi:MAG: hypothetical protein SGJ27_26770 [Candidatus Melainabacteria bacterium]|nr:hypothetical protein [Candidatus Melainabacteria bacterium]
MSKKVELDPEVASLLRKKRDYSDEKVLAVEDAKEVFLACTENLESNSEVTDFPFYVEKSKISQRSRFKNSPPERLEAAIEFNKVHNLVAGTFDHTFRGMSGRPRELLALNWDLSDAKDPMTFWSELMETLINGQSKRELLAFQDAITKKAWCAKKDWKLSGPNCSLASGFKGTPFPPHIIAHYLNKCRSIEEMNQWTDEYLANPANGELVRCPLCQGNFLHV